MLSSPEGGIPTETPWPPAPSLLLTMGPAADAIAVDDDVTIAADDDFGHFKDEEITYLKFWTSKWSFKPVSFFSI